MILKQGIMYRYVGKGKWIHLWYVCTYKEDGAYLTLCKDSTAKKPLENSIHLKRAAERIRFGATCIQANGFPECGKDLHIHPSAYIAVLGEIFLKKKETWETLWLCAESVLEMFDLIKVISSCHTSQKAVAPPVNEKNDTNALHNYLPIAFDPKSPWERYYDNPCRNLLVLSNATTIIRSSSADDLSRKRTLKELKKVQQEKHQKVARSMTVLNDIDVSRSASVEESFYSSRSEQQLTPSPTVRSKNGTCSDFQRQFEHPVAAAVEKSCELTPLYRSTELAERPVVAPKPPSVVARLRQNSISSQQSQGDTGSSTVSQSPIAPQRRSLRNCVHVLPPLPNKKHRHFLHAEVQTDVSLISSSRTVIIETFNEPMNYKHTEWQTISLRELPIIGENGQNISLEDENLHIKIEELKNTNTDELHEEARRVNANTAKPTINRPTETSAAVEDELKTVETQMTFQPSLKPHLGSSLHESFTALSREPEAQLFGTMKMSKSQNSLNVIAGNSHLPTPTTV